MKYNKKHEAAFKEFKIKAIVLSLLLVVAAIFVVFYCEHNLPLFSEASTVTYTGTCEDIRLVSDHGPRGGQNIYAMIRVYDNSYYIPPATINDYRYDEDKLKDTFEGRDVKLTVSKHENRQGFRTVLRLEVNGIEAISVKDTHSYFKSVRAAIWAIFIIASAAIYLILFQRSPDAVPVIKHKFGQVKEKLKPHR